MLEVFGRADREDVDAVLGRVFEGKKEEGKAVF